MTWPSYGALDLKESIHVAIDRGGEVTRYLVGMVKAEWPSALISGAAAHVKTAANPWAF